MDIQYFWKSDSATKLEIMLKDPDFISKLEIEEIYVALISLKYEDEMKILRNIDFLKKSNILQNREKIAGLFIRLRDEDKQKLLLDREFIEKELNLDSIVITLIIDSLKSSEIKLEMINLYLDKISRKMTRIILESCPGDTIISIIIKEKCKFSKVAIKEILSSIKVDLLVNTFIEYRKILYEKGITIYDIIMEANEDVQLEIVSELVKRGITDKEKKRILTILDDKQKEKLDKSIFPQEETEYKLQLSHEIGAKYGKIVVDFSKDLEIYKDLDELIYVNPIELKDEERVKIQELAEICPNIGISDDIGASTVTLEEYKEAEKWIDWVLQGINPEWTNIQGVAYVDYVLGKNITYCPYLDTEIYNSKEVQNMWKVANKKTGVCWGISELEKYILSKIGIEAEVIKNRTHVFLKLKNIELPQKDGEVVKGDTYLDSTWNLSINRYGGLPENFCNSYEEIRKYDKIESKGIDTEAHKINENGVTLSLDKRNVREIFKSIGATDEKGNFPIQKFMSISNMIDASGFPAEKTVEIQLMLLAGYYPGFAICQNETASILRGILSNINFNRCVVNRVYERDDENKEPVLYVYADLPEVGKKFYFADKETNKFVGLPEKEFEQRFECYQKDLEKQNGHRPWEDIEEKQEYRHKSSIPATAKDTGGR